MLKITPDPPTFSLEKPPQADPLSFVANDQLSAEDALVCAAEMLRGAIAMAYECGDHLKGYQRDLAFGVLNQMQMISTMVNASLDKFPADKAAR